MTVALVTDTTADLPPDVAVGVVPARIAFGGRNYLDGDLRSDDFYPLLATQDNSPQPSSPTEADYRAVFEKALVDADSVMCLVTPFDTVTSFAVATAAAVKLPGATVRIVNPGVASAGLCSLTLSFLSAIEEGSDLARLLAAVDELAPRSDTLFVAASLDWLERAGHLAVIEGRLGPIDGRVPVVRAGTRLTGVALADDHGRAIDAAVDSVGRRAGDDTSVVATVTHASAPGLAADVAQRCCDRWNVARLVVTELSPTYGSQFGPGAVGVGIAPMPSSA